VSNGLFGRQAGTIQRYAYTEANRNSGITWTPERFAEYVRNPRALRIVSACVDRARGLDISRSAAAPRRAARSR
jgi:hypothetical protein